MFGSVYYKPIYWYQMESKITKLLEIFALFHEYEVAQY